MPDSLPPPPPLASLQDIPQAGVLEVDAIVEGRPESLILHHTADRPRAWLNVCPHAGRRLDWAPGQFLTTADGKLVCAVHGATFELGEGLCVSGPCRGQSLQAVALQLHDGKVWLAP